MNSFNFYTSWLSTKFTRTPQSNVIISPLVASHVECIYDVVTGARIPDSRTVKSSSTELEAMLLTSQRAACTDRCEPTKLSVIICLSEARRFAPLCEVKTLHSSVDSNVRLPRT